MTQTIQPLLELENGRADVLYVLPWLRRDFDIDIDGTAPAKKFFDICKKVIPNYVAITLKPTPGIWKDDEVEARLQEHRHRIDKAVSDYRPGAVVFLGVNFAKQMIKDLRSSKQDLRGTFSSYVLKNKKSIPAMVWAAPDKIIEDVYEFTRMPETLSKLWFLAKKKGYNDKPNITNLNTYKSAAEYIDFLAHEHTGVIGFDTETYSLNRVHHQRLGSMQFCANANDSYVLLWDSKHQELSKRDQERLTPKLVHLFGSPDTLFKYWTMHNGQFDLAQVRGSFHTRMPKPIIDTMYLMHLLDESRNTTARIWAKDLMPYALKTLVLEFLGFTHYSDEAMKARNNGTLMDLPLGDFLDYSGYDPIVTFRLLKVLGKWAKIEKYYDTVMRLLTHLHSRALKLYVDMSINGFQIDQGRLRELLSKDSVINKRLVDIKEEYRIIPEIQAVNKELAEDQAQSTMFFKVPWIFDMAKTKHRSALFFHSRHGYKLAANEEGKYSTGKAFQKINSGNKVVGLYAESQGLVKLRDAYVKPIFEALFANPDPNADTSDGRVHPEFQLHRTVTGRVACRAPNCIREGTPVLVPCDRVENKTQSVAIENIKVGDYVYSLDKNRKLTIRKVLNVWNKGKAETLRLHMKSGNGRVKSVLDVTPDHKIRSLDGSWVRVSDLIVGSRVMSAGLSHGLNNHVVTKITKSKTKHTVWDIEVEGTHNFFAGTVNVHNCQQVPRSDSPVKKEIKSLFCPGPGKILLQADLSSAEVRVWGALSGDKEICRLSQEAFLLLANARANPNDKKLREEAELKANFHKQTYGLCYHIDPKDVTPPQRQIAKKLTFGITYGMSDSGLARELGVSVEEAIEIKKVYFSVYRGGEKWLADTQEFALTNGYVETPMGRRRRMPQVFTGDRKFVAEAKRFAVNAPIQATASDYAMLSTCILNDALIKDGVESDVCIVNAVHDSVVLEVTANAEWIQYASKLVRRVFTKDVVKVLKRDFDFDLKAPIDIDIEVSQHYMHKCKKCGNKQYPGQGDACTGEVKTGKKKPDGSDEKTKCGHDKYEVIENNAGWGWLTGLEENAQGIAKAMKGIKQVSAVSSKSKKHAVHS